MSKIRIAPEGADPMDPAAWTEIGGLNSPVELTSTDGEVLQAWGSLVTAAFESFTIALKPLATNFALLGAWLGALGLKPRRVRVRKRVRRAGERVRKLEAKEARRVHRALQRAGVVR